MSNTWFDVDKEGLARLLERRGKFFAFTELLANAFDAPGVTRVDVTTTPVPGRPLVDVVVSDDSPTGFTRLDHAFTLFADSSKRADVESRGRFNLGEKLCLALAESAEIQTTTGTVRFSEQGRSVSFKARRAVGSVVRMRMRMTRAELDEALIQMDRIFPPCLTCINGDALTERVPLRTFSASLMTEWSGDDGVMRRGMRKTLVRVFEPLPGQPAVLAEMGMPVCETGDRYDVDIGQKVPVPMDRDSVTPAFLRSVRVAVTNAMADLLDATSATSPWVNDALALADDEALRKIVTTRFGERVASFDPSDREASHHAVSAGFTVIPGGTFTAEVWSRLRASEVIMPAGQLFPSASRKEGGAEEARPVNGTPAMRRCAVALCAIAHRLIGAPVEIAFANEFGRPFLAWYGNRRMTLNVARLGKAWFEGPLQSKHIDLLVHELGHEYESNHLSKNFNDALTRLAGDAVMLALQEPCLFVLSPDPLE